MYKVLVFLLVVWSSLGHGAPSPEERRGATYEINVNDQVNASLVQQNRQKRRSGTTCEWVEPGSYSCQGNEVEFGGGWVCGTDSARPTGRNRVIVDEGRDTLDVELSWEFTYILKIFPSMRIGNTSMSGSYRVYNPKFCLSFKVSYRRGCSVEVNYFGQCGHGHVLLWSSVPEYDWTDFTSTYNDCILPNRNKAVKASENRLREDLEDIYCPSEYQPDQQLGDRFGSANVFFLIEVTVGNDESHQVL